MSKINKKELFIGACDATLITAGAVGMPVNTPETLKGVTKPPGVHWNFNDSC